MSYKGNRKIYYCLLKVSFVREGKIDSMTDVTLYNITFTHIHAHTYYFLIIFASLIPLFRSTFQIDYEKSFCTVFPCPIVSTIMKPKPF